MFIIYRCYDYEGELVYNSSSIIGIYTDYVSAKDDLIKKLTKLKYELEIDHDHEKYFFTKIIKKNGKDITSYKLLCFEILEKNLNLDEIKMKS